MFNYFKENIMDMRNRRLYLVGCVFLGMQLLSCSMVNEAHSSQVNSESIQHDGTENDYVLGKDFEVARLSKVTKFAEVGEPVVIDESYEKSNPYEITIRQTKITDTFEEELSKWEDFILEDIEIKDKKIVGKEKIVYIDYTLKNCGNEKLEFYTPTVLLESVEDDYLSGIEMAFSSENKGGKSAYQVLLAPGESKDIRIGYIIPENRLNDELYINLTGSVSLEDDCCLVKL
ncbi:hypothetical protein [Agathobacter ruminis]|nr:hypothetical protein [Agathobacter ruminis]